MRISELLRLVWMNLSQNKFKVILTAVGIIVGSATIMMVLAIGTGGKLEVAEQFKNLNAGAIDISYESNATEFGSSGGGFGGGFSGGGGGGGAPAYVPPTPGVGTAIGGAAGIMTGGAASSDSESELKLGEGIVACSVSATGASTGSAAFDVQNLSVSYFPQRGTITLMGGSLEQLNMIEKFIKANVLPAYLMVTFWE